MKNKYFWMAHKIMHNFNIFSHVHFQNHKKPRKTLLTSERLNTHSALANVCGFSLLHVQLYIYRPTSTKLDKWIKKKARQIFTVWNETMNIFFQKAPSNVCRSAFGANKETHKPYEAAKAGLKWKQKVILFLREGFKKKWRKVWPFQH